MRKAVWLLLTMAFLVRPVEAQDGYKYYMDLCERSKRAGDYGGMEAAIQQALRYGRGDEYAWRSLAWAQARQGKWNASLENARRNIQRNGATGWALAQFADSALGYGDFANASNALAQANRLPFRTLAGSEGTLKSCVDRLLAATCDRTFELQFEVDLHQGGPGQPPVWLLIPQKETSLQSFTFTVRNAVAYKERHDDFRDYIEVVQKPGEPFFVEGRLVLKPFCLGVKRLEQVPASDCPQELKVYLSRFQNWSWWDPELPEVQSIARTVKGRTSAKTVQNILDWFKMNIRYDASIKDDPALGQLGTILKLRYGGCHHNCGLFVTLCRASGVPACVAHGNPLPMDDKPFEISQPVGHGWAEVYINGIGWVPVEPTDADSLRQFTISRAYLSLGASNRPPDHHYFSDSIKHGGEEFRVASIQHCLEIHGRLLGIDAPKADKRSKLRGLKPK